MSHEHFICKVCLTYIYRAKDEIKSTRSENEQMKQINVSMQSVRIIRLMSEGKHKLRKLKLATLGLQESSSDKLSFEERKVTIIQTPFSSLFLLLHPFPHQTLLLCPFRNKRKKKYVITIKKNYQSPILLIPLYILSKF